MYNSSTFKRGALNRSRFISDHCKITSKKLLAICMKLTQLFSSSATITEPRHRSICDGRIRLFRRPDSQHWQCRFRLGSGTWHQATTGTAVVDQAETRAVAIYETVRLRVSNDLAIRTKSFRRVAAEEVQALRHARSGRLTKQTTGD